MKHFCHLIRLISEKQNKYEMRRIFRYSKVSSKSKRRVRIHDKVIK